MLPVVDLDRQPLGLSRFGATAHGLMRAVRDQDESAWREARALLREPAQRLRIEGLIGYTLEARYGRALRPDLRALYPDGPIIVPERRLILPATGELVVPLSAAIAVNNPQSQRGTSSTLTLSYTVSAGSNLILVFAVGTAHASSTATTVSSATYNGSAATNVAGATGTASSGSERIHFSYWYQLAPTVGTANIVANLSSTPEEAVLLAVVLSDAAQQAPEASATATDASSPCTTTLTTLTDGAIHLGGLSAQNSGAAYTPDGNTTEAVERDGTVAVSGVLGYRFPSPAGSSSLGWTTTSLNTSQTGSCSWAPFAGGGALSIPVAMHHYRQQGMA